MPFSYFTKLCFKKPQRTARSNLVQTYVDTARIPQAILQLRAQQIEWSDFLTMWDLLHNNFYLARV